MGPITRTLDVTVLDRIPVDVIHMTPIIVLIPDQMFPIAMLPERALLALRASSSHEIRTIQADTTALRDGAFDDAPTCREIAVIGRQCPDTMQMIWQQHPGVDGEGMGLPRQRNTFPQCRADVVVQQEGLAVQGVDGEEIRPATDIGAPVARHAGLIFDRRVGRALHPRQSCVLRRRVSRAEFSIPSWQIWIGALNTRPYREHKKSEPKLTSFMLTR